MELYILDDGFLREFVIDEYTSLIWAERYSKAGDVELVLPVTPERISRLAEGKFLTMRDSDEIMLIESQLIEDDVLKIKGRTPETFLNERYIRTSADPAVKEWVIKDRPGNILSKIVNDVAIAGTASVGLGATDNIIPYLAIGTIDQSDPVISKSLSFGPAYDPMAEIAETAKLGMKLYLSRADPFGYELTFTAYKGIDRSSAQLENDLVRFSSAEDSMTNIKQINSAVGYKTVVYVFPPNWSESTPPVVVYAPTSSALARGFKRRVLVIEANDIAEAQIVSGTTLLSLMQKAGQDALANNNYTKLVDGEVVPQPQYRYGESYKLGDTIELVGHDDIVQKARITEYIRSKDASGERAYPTVSVID